MHPREKSSARKPRWAIASGAIQLAGVAVPCYVTENHQRVLHEHHAIGAIADGAHGIVDARGFAQAIEGGGTCKTPPRPIDVATSHGVAKGIRVEDFNRLPMRIVELYVTGTLAPELVPLAARAWEVLVVAQHAGARTLAGERLGSSAAAHAYRGGIS